MFVLGWDGDLFILAFDHRGSFVKKFFRIDGHADAGGRAPHRRRQGGDQ